METETHIFFWGGEFSQWYKSKFTIDGIKYNCAEQYMMAQKALTFNDFESHHEIMMTKSPSTQKAIGRQVKNFDAIKWNEVSRLVVYRANLAKFTQNPELLKYILSTGNKIIVEASPEDKIWGIGLHENDPRCLDETQWQGTNWLGIACMQVRSDIRQLDSIVGFDLRLNLNR